MSSIRVKLCVMMFLEHFHLGSAWYPLFFGYLAQSRHFGEWEQFAILATFNVAAIIAMFFSARLVDRNFAAEKFLAFSHPRGRALLSWPGRQVS